MSTVSNQLETRLQNVEQSLAKTGAKLKRGAIVTCVVGLALLSVVMGYFVFGYNEIKDLADPHYLVPFGTQMVDDQIPGLRESAKTQLITSAPAWAETLSTTAIEYIPEARKGLETFILDKADEAIDKAVVMGEEQMRHVIAEHRTELNQAFKDLASDEDKSKEAVAALTKALNDEIGRDMKDQAREVLGTMTALREKLERLRSNQALVKDEMLERSIIMTIRHLQLREAEAKPAADMAALK